MIMSILCSQIFKKLLTLIDELIAILQFVISFTCTFYTAAREKE